MDLHDRLNEVVDYTNLSVLAFAKKCGVKQQTLFKHLKGLAEPNVATLIGIGNAFPEISMEWLVMGRGEMIKNEGREMVHVDKMLDTIAALNGALSAQGETIELLKNRIKELETK